MKGQTKKITPVYTKPDLNKDFLALNLLAFRDLVITEVKKTLNPFNGNEEEAICFGKTTAGWLLIQHNDTVYFEEDGCPICLCEVSEEPHFKLPCCGNELHAECFLQQLKSFKRGLWTGTHLHCPLCRENFFEGDRTSQWFWVDYQPLYEVVSRQPGFNYRDFENAIQSRYSQYQSVKKLLKEKDDSVPEEERGGWAVQICDLCQCPHISGKLTCAEEMNFDFDAEFVCDACEWGHKEAKDHRCFKHGKKYAVFKCDSCCSLATWDCFSNHYCERCHQSACSTKNYPCPGPDKCPLGIAHPKNSHGRHGEHNLGFVVGCFKCIDPTYEVNSSYSANAPDPFRAADLNNNEHIGMFRYAAPPPQPEPEPEKPIAMPIAEPLEEDEDSENEIYGAFIAQFHEESSSEEEEEDEHIAEPLEDEEHSENEVYEAFIAQFHAESSEEEETEEEEKVFPEENEIYAEFISQFQPSDAETYSSESDSSEISLEIPAFAECEEEQVLPIIAPRPMIYNHSCDSVLSEDTLNLLHFNQGFDLFVDDDDEDEVSASVVQIPPQVAVV